MTRARLGVLVSGSGSNLQALIDASLQPSFPAEVALVMANVPQAYALKRAEQAGIPTAVIEHGAFPSRSDFEQALVARLRGAQVEWLCLAGFMRLVGPTLLEGFSGRVLNIHPSLLPSFPGLHAPRQALAHGVKLAGCTVHFVDAGTDTGPIIAQAVVPVLPTDDEASLAARILKEEHKLYPLAVQLVTTGQVRVDGRLTRTKVEPHQGPGFLQNPGAR